MNFEAASSEVFQILRSYNYEVLLFDDEHNQVFEPSEARRFFARPVNLLVSIIDDGDDSSIRLYLSKSTGVKKVLGLIQALRAMGITKYKMVFNVREYNKELSPKDFASQAAVRESEDHKMNLVEGMYGTSRSSYLKLENARMIVRHSTRINENILGARGRNVDTIHIEDGQGQRYLMPTRQLAPARAMAHHVDNGGTWADDVGQHISRMAQDFADLGDAARHINNYAPELNEAAPAIRETVREAARAMRKTFEGLGRKTRYAEICESICKQAETLNEGGADSDRITELAGMLNTPGVQLSERVLTTVARVMKEADEAAAQATPQPTVMVLGQPVLKAAWDLFKSGELQLNHPVKIDPSKPKLFNFKEVVSAVHDDTMTNLLNTVLQRMHQRDRTPGLGAIAVQALRAAGAESAPRPEGEPAGLPAVREFLEWANGFNVERLLETDRLPMPSEPNSEGPIRDAVDNFDYNDFMASGYAREFSHDLLDRLSPEEKTFTKAQVVSAVEGYLQDKLADLGHGVNIDQEANTVAAQVIEYMQADGYEIHDADMAEDACMADRDFLSNGEDELDENCGMCDGDGDETQAERVLDEDDLTQEDVLLPSSQRDDLTGEVTKATVQDVDGERAPDDAYIDRLTALAGVRSGRAN